MSLEPIGRPRFFIYTILLSIAQVVATVMAVLMMTFVGARAGSSLDESPGAGSQAMSVPLSVIALVFLLGHAAIMWRRGRDAGFSSGLIGFYIAAVASFTFLQVSQTLGFGAVPGRGFVGIIIFGMFCHLLFARGKPVSADPDAFLASAGHGGPARRMVEASVSASYAPAPRSAPMASASAHRTGFGRRGLA